jgi:predicted membrane protein
MDLSSKNAKWAIVFIILGAIALLNNFRVFDIWGSIWRLWPLLLVLLGIHMLRKRATCAAGGMRVFGDTVETTDSPYIKQSSAFGDINFKVASREFAGGSASTVFGTISLDLADIRQLSGYGQLDIHTVFGDITIKLPREIPVEVFSNNIFGSLKGPGGDKISDKCYRSSGGEGGKVLAIHCSQVFGDINLIRAETVSE